MQRRSDDPKEETGLNDARKLRQSINYDRRNGLHMNDAFGDTSLGVHMAILVMLFSFGKIDFNCIVYKGLVEIDDERLMDPRSNFDEQSHFRETVAAHLRVRRWVLNQKNKID